MSNTSAASQARFAELLRVPIAARDQAWEDGFLREFPLQPLSVLSPNPQEGPDGWPYLLAQTGGADPEPALGPLEWLAKRGIGLVINPMSEAPDYVLTYGMIWNFRERGEFITKGTGGREGALSIKDGQKLFVGPPSESYLPPYVRSILRQFFLDQGTFAPKVLMISTDGESYDLSFSLESLGSLPEKEHAGVLEALSWFLPGHYGLAIVSEKAVPGWQAL